MTILSLPSGLLIERQSFGIRRPGDLTFASDYTGAIQARPLGPQRWASTLVSPQWMTQADAAIWQVLLLQLRGQVNQLALGDLQNIAPTGTMRGTMALNGSLAQNATTVNISAGSGQAGTTLAAGDLLQIDTGSARELVMVTVGGTADGSGNIAVTVEPPIRAAHSNGASVVWDTPTALFRMASTALDWSLQNILKGGFSLDLIESW